MKVYYDTTALLPLYLNDSLSLAVTEYTINYGQPILINAFQELEMANVIRQKVGRGEFSAATAETVLAKIGEHLTAGYLVRRPVNWLNVFSEAQRLSEVATVRHGCRVADLLHLAVAIQWECDLLLSAAERQLGTAVAVGFKTLDLRQAGSLTGDASTIR